MQDAFGTEARLSLILTKILAHLLGFTRRPITPRNHIPKNYVFSCTPLTPLVWLRHCVQWNSEDFTGAFGNVGKPFAERRAFGSGCVVSVAEMLSGRTRRVHDRSGHGVGGRDDAKHERGTRHRCSTQQPPTMRAVVLPVVRVVRSHRRPRTLNK